MSDTVNIKKLEKKDSKAFFNLRLEALKNFPAAFMSSYEEERDAGNSFYESLLNQTENNNLIFGAFLDSNLIGCIGLFQEKKIKAKHKCIMWGMYVQPSYQKHGVGKMLVQAAINHAKDQIKCSIINTSIESTNVAAKNLYESFGFKTWGTEIKAMCIDGQFYDEHHQSLFLL